MCFVPPRRKRRPALACEECRRRKVRCDRQSPCTPCIKANLPNCLYVRDDRDNSAKAPFEAGETQFSVFEQTLVGLRSLPPSAPAASQVEAVQSGMDVQQQHYHHENPFGMTIQHVQRPSDASSFDIQWDPSSVEMSSIDSPTFDMPSHGRSSWEVLSPTSTSIETDESMPLYPSLSSASTGAFYKGRSLARSHWIHYAHQSSEVIALIQVHEKNQHNHGIWTFSRCKAIRRAIKAREAKAEDSMHNGLSMGAMVPTKNVSDQLVRAYLRTFQAVFKILHVPTFIRDYSQHWKSPTSSSQLFTIIMMLVFSIGSRFSSDEPGVSRALTRQWITAASNWLSSAKERSRICLDGLRVQCLLLLARKVNGIPDGADRLCTGSIYRSAMDAGLLQVHEQDKGEDDARNRTETEARRRLWFTIVELDLQTSMDWGSLPIVSVEDINCPLPSNTEDARLSDGEGGPGVDAAVPQPQPLGRFTQSSLQILLARTLPVRLKVARFLNKQQQQQQQQQDGPECSFDTALALSAQLLDEFRQCHDLIREYRRASTPTPPTPFQTRLFDLLMRRFVLGLHHPFAVKAMDDPRYAYSRQICTDTSMALLAHLQSSSSPRSDEPDSRRLQLRGAGLFRDVYLQGALYLMGEMTNQVDAGASFLSTSQRSDAARREMRELVDRFGRLALDRIAAGETNIKRHVLVSCLLAQTDAKQQAMSVEVKVSRALEQALEKCGSLLQAQLQAVPDVRSMDYVAQRNGSMSQPDWTQLEWDEFLA